MHAYKHRKKLYNFNSEPVKCLEERFMEHQKNDLLLKMYTVTILHVKSHVAVLVTPTIPVAQVSLGP